MSDLKVSVVKLPPQRVASVLAFGPEPEHAAWNKLVAWAEPKGFLNTPEQHPIFGFNNPSPSAGSPNYGYEFWLNVGPEVEPEGEVKIKEVPGGLYAVTRCETQGQPQDVIPATWKALVLWRERSRYKQGTHQWLEKHISGGGEEELVLDLYLPVAE